MDGTMYDNMEFHLQAWEKMVAELGSDLKGKKLFRELYGKNTEVLERVFGPGRFTESEKEVISKKKDEYFRAFYAPHLTLIKGLREFLFSSRERNILLGIGTAGLTENVDFALDGTGIRDLFGAIITEADVTNSKPNPETFTRTAAQLQVAPDDAIVFEDVPKGVEAAANAGMKVVVILTSHTKEDFSSCDNIVAMVEDYSSLVPESLFTQPVFA